jgi:hypothetical protein
MLNYVQEPISVSFPVYCLNSTYSLLVYLTTMSVSQTAIRAFARRGWGKQREALFRIANSRPRFQPGTHRIPSKKWKQLCSNVRLWNRRFLLFPYYRHWNQIVVTNNIVMAMTLILIMSCFFSNFTLLFIYKDENQCEIGKTSRTTFVFETLSRMPYNCCFVYSINHIMSEKMLSNFTRNFWSLWSC